MEYTLQDCQIGQNCGNFKIERKEGNKVVLLGSLITNVGTFFEKTLNLTECDLIKIRAATLSLTEPICPKHRFALGKYYRPPSYCKSHFHPAKSKTKAENISFALYQKIKKKYPNWSFVLGDKLCRNCRKSLSIEEFEDDQHDKDFVPDFLLSSDNEVQDKLQTMNSLLTLLGLNPISKIINEPIKDIDELELHYFKNVHTQIKEKITQTFCELITPGQEEQMLNLLNDNSENFDLTHLIEAFQQCKTRNARVSVLSLIPKKRLSKLKTIEIFGCTTKEIDDARSICKKIGPCAEKMKTTESVYSRLSITKCEHFINFLFDTGLLQETAYGSSVIRYSSGEKISVTSTILNGLNEFAVAQYLLYCQDTNYPSLSRSTLRRLLDKMNPKTRKQLCGVDSFIVEGVESFQVTSFFPFIYLFIFKPF